MLPVYKKFPEQHTHTQKQSIANDKNVINICMFHVLFLMYGPSLSNTLSEIILCYKIR